MTKHERYNKSPKGRARYARYEESASGRRNRRIHRLRGSNQRRSDRIKTIEKEMSHL